MRRCPRRGTPVRCATPKGVAFGVVFDRQLPREREHGLVYVRLTADGPLGTRGQRLHVPLAGMRTRSRRVHARPRRRRRVLQLQPA